MHVNLELPLWGLKSRSEDCNKICYDVEKVEQKTRVSHIVFDMGIWNPICEAKDVVHYHNCYDFVQYLLSIITPVFIGSNKSNQYQLCYCSHYEDQKL